MFYVSDSHIIVDLGPLTLSPTRRFSRSRVYDDPVTNAVTITEEDVLCGMHEAGFFLIGLKGWSPPSMDAYDLRGVTCAFDGVKNLSVNSPMVGIEFGAF
ncbi:hypothetical protein EVAR_5625_1 [Eumeta japonica]|uniref:Uncharacterized protein n=1 Tax=Eumeta variegata TaxID=151549 RepID=A0A4C1T730_EUMVA|nr:hypothetical protein EVAR_5625_1 [Eumeta japonica]